MPETATTYLDRTRPSRAPFVLSLGLALGLAGLLAGCGGDEPPAKEPEQALAGGKKKGPGGKTAKARDAETSTEPRGPARQRFDMPTRVTPAPEGTAPDALATLSGVARIDGPVPERKRQAMDHIAGCKEHKSTLSETVLAKETGELQNVVVYVISGIDRETVGPAPEEPVVLTQEGCVFKPHLAVVRAGQQLLVRNEDSARHNVNIRPNHGSNKGMNVMQPTGADDLEVSFPRADVAVSISCDLHSWMKAWVAVVDHPYYSVSDEDGVWSVDVPPGEYVVEAWHERYGKLKGTIAVGPGETGEVTFDFESGKRRN